MDVEPLEQPLIKKSKESLPNETQLIDIEDPW